MRKFLREKELMRALFPEGMEEFQQLLYCETSKNELYLKQVLAFSCSLT